jgi:hypothetical protein
MYSVNVAQVQQDVNEMRGDVEDTRLTVQGISLGQRQTDVKRWLLPPDPSINYNKALEERQESTGLWLLQNPAYVSWKTRQPSALWLHGILGCGKTILSSTVIEDVENTCPSGTLLYFYFDFNDDHKQTFDSMIRSLISQLCRKSENAWEQLSSLFHSCENGRRQPNTRSLCKVLMQMTEPLQSVIIVLDALDECKMRTEPHSEGLLSWIRNLIGSGYSNIRFLVTSRPEQDIQLTLSGLVDKEHVIAIKSDLIRSDICAYICARVREGKGLERWREHPDVQEEIEGTLTRKAHGM